MSAKTPQAAPETETGAHTELRPQGQGEEARAKLKPRTPPEKLPDADEDGQDDLFNDMPV